MWGVPSKSLRCPYCDEAWPHSEDFEACPRCHEQTAPSATEPMDELFAYDIKKNADFGWYLLSIWLAGEPAA